MRGQRAADPNDEHDAASDPPALHRRLSHNENQQQPLPFEVRLNRREMVPLLLELGADPLALDGFGLPVAAYATGPDMAPRWRRGAGGIRAAATGP